MWKKNYFKITIKLFHKYNKYLIIKKYCLKIIKINKLSLEKLFTKINKIKFIKKNKRYYVKF